MASAATALKEKIVAEFENFIKERRGKLRTWTLYSDEEISRVEQRLGVIIPDDLKVALRELGFGHYTKVDGLETPGGIVEWTERYRSLFKLPPEYIVLNEMGDVGMILIHLPTGITYWIGLYDYDALMANEPLQDPIVFSSYGEFVMKTITDLETNGKEF